MHFNQPQILSGVGIILP